MGAKRKINCDYTGNSREMTLCSSMTKEAASVLMHETQEIVTTKVPTKKESIISSQEKWWEYVRSDCATYSYDHGDLSGLVYNGCLESHIYSRIARLKKYTCYEIHRSLRSRVRKTLLAPSPLASRVG